MNCGWCKQKEATYRCDNCPKDLCEDCAKKHNLTEPFKFNPAILIHQAQILDKENG